MLMIAYALLFVILLGRLWYIQVFMEERYKVAAQENRIRIHRVKAARGFIYDRGGSPLAINLPTFGLSFVPASLLRNGYPSVEDFLRELSMEVSIPYDEVCRNYKRRFYSNYWPVMILDNLTLVQVVDLRNWLSSKPFLSLEVDSRRFYPWGDLFAHILGYTAEISERELKLYGNRGYRGGDQIGKLGVERVYEDYLKGLDGYREIEVDALGREVSVLKESPPVNGFSLVLNIDRHLQKVAYDALGENRGCVVVMDPKDGSVLALVSKPSFDPNTFVWGIDSWEWRDLVGNPDRPMFNRAVQAELPPGSLFKVVVALGALSEGVVSPSRRVLCTGSLTVGNREFKCWREGGHGVVDLYQAIAQSCNIYFYTVGRELGVGKISSYAKRCGLGIKTGVDLDSEAEGFIPTAEWKKKKIGEPWYPGDTINFSIGQSYLLVTPIQLASLVSAIANGGTFYRPKVAQLLQDEDGNIIERFNPEVYWELSLPKSVIDEVRKGMRLAVSDGTARALSGEFKVAGKTGSAQNPRGKEHAWFMGFAPYDDPKVTIVVLVEEGGMGGGVAVPIAKKILDFFFRRYGYGSGKA